MNSSVRPVKQPRRAVDGVVLLNKPRGISSQQAVSRVRYLFQAVKAGHTGTLDPAADGLLPVCLGEATKFSQFLLDADKTYVATLHLGLKTTTGDAEGDVLETRPPVTDRQAILLALDSFKGEIMQTPPMHSALKYKGKPLYEYARQGEVIDRAPRRVTIYDIQVFDFKGVFLTLCVRCSKGTYIRVLAEDIGIALGCGASLSALTRTQTGILSLDHEAACTLGALQAMAESQRDTRLLPVDTLLAPLPALMVDSVEAQRLLVGQKLGLKRVKICGLARVYGPNQRFLGLVEVDPEGRTVPLRLVAQYSGKDENQSPENLEKTPV